MVKNGLLVPIDDVAAMTKAILSIIEDKEKGVELGNQGKRISELVSKGKVVEKWNEIIQGIME